MLQQEGAWADLLAILLTAVQAASHTNTGRDDAVTVSGWGSLPAATRSLSPNLAPKL